VYLTPLISFTLLNTKAFHGKPIKIYQPDIQILTMDRADIKHVSIRDL
jgi:hypothetical protein